ncbi:VG15 protein [Kribbella sp. WER1]
MDRLTQQHRKTLADLREELTIELSRIWPDVDLAAFSRMYPHWEEAAYELTLRYREGAAKAARDYLLSVRRSAGVRSKFEPVQEALLDREAFAASMRATALSVLTDADNQVSVANYSFAPPAETAAIRRNARARALVTSVGASVRQMINGSRDTIYNGVRDDSRALGWMRVTDGKPCSFCAMLASRGAVYKSKETAGGSRAYHDHCSCFPKPLYRADEPLPENAREFLELWKESTKGLSSNAAQNAFRRAYDAKYR